MTNFSLPQLLAPNAPGPGIKRSRRAVWRALALVTLNGLIIAHIIQWKITGRTVSPVEPSEAMYTLEQGQVNAGFIFLVVAMVTVLIFGRFVCGWACHIVALQDLCGWMMKRIGIRPKQFRARLLGYVPLTLALYMFVWPTVERMLVAPIMRARWPEGLVYLGDAVPFELPRLENHLMTEDFWATFGNVWMALPFLFVVGFATVYFLGAKGFCAYGCPYGGIFGVLDKVSVGRIIVDPDKCEGCGHCTAACTSNVRVHEEIREYGFVVDPGCLKDMDCVSVCPNEALAFKFAKPSIRKGAAKNRKPRRVYDCTLPEEIGVIAVFAIIFYASRGAWGLIPMLMAVGIAGCGTFLAWKAWRIVRDRDARLNSFQLKRAGRIRPAGWALLAVVAVSVPALADGFVVKAIRFAGDLDDRRVAVPSHVVLGGQFDLVTEEHRRFAQRAIDRFELARRLSFGPGNMHTAGVSFRIAWLKLTLGDLEGASEILTRLVAENPDDERLAINAAIVLRMQERYGDAERLYADALAAHPGFGEVRKELAGMLLVTDRGDEAEALYRSALDYDPQDIASRSALGVLLVAQGRAAESIVQFRKVIELEPLSASAHNDLGVGLFALGSYEPAIEAMTKACELDEANPHYPRVLAQMLDRLGRGAEASKWRAEAQGRAAAGSDGP